MITIKTILQEATNTLANKYASARIDSEILLCFVLNKERAYLYAHPDQDLSLEEAHTFQTLVRKREQNMPVAYLTGQREFWSLPLTVNAFTLIPRPETELLIEIILHRYAKEHDLTVLDLATGSGAIALALASERSHWKIIASDISQEALMVAHENAQKFNCSNVCFFQSDWFTAIDNAQLFDVIVSNPPYLASDDKHLQEGDVQFEPLLALVAEQNGLAALKHIIYSGLAKLKPGGLLLVEHGFDQHDAVTSLFHTAGYETIQSWQDGQGHHRVCGGHRPSA